MSSFFATCNTNKQSMSTRSLMVSSLLDKSIMKFWISSPQNRRQSSNNFLAQSSVCLLALQPSLLTFFNSNPLISRKSRFCTEIIIRRIIINEWLLENVSKLAVAASEFGEGEWSIVKARGNWNSETLIVEGTS